MRNVSVADGTFVTDEQNTELANRSRSSVPPSSPTSSRPARNPSGKIIRINGQEFTVIGVTVAQGGTGFGSADDEVYIPLATEQLYLAGNQYLSTIDVQAANSNDMTQVQNDITTLLFATTRHHESRRRGFQRPEPS